MKEELYSNISSEKIEKMKMMREVMTDFMEIFADKDDKIKILYLYSQISTKLEKITDYTIDNKEKNEEVFKEIVINFEAFINSLDKIIAKIE